MQQSPDPDAIRMFVRTLQVRALMYVVTLTREVMKVR